MSELCVFMLCKLYKDGKNLETSWGLQNEKKKSMQTTDVKVVRHQQSFAEYTCACRKPGKDVFYYNVFFFVMSGWEVGPKSQSL